MKEERGDKQREHCTPPMLEKANDKLGCMEGRGEAKDLLISLH